jgi:exonuclease SbcD
VGTLDDVAAAADGAGDAWLRVIVREPARAGLADEVRARLPRAVDVRIERTTVEPTAELVPRRGRSARELFAEYLASEGVDDARVRQLFERLHDDVLAEVT